MVARAKFMNMQRLPERMALRYRLVGNPKQAHEPGFAAKVGKLR